jgi:septal ring factor EnvC (AmiA/AmiB activator)
MIIIEHDNNYISLYGYNRAVYKKEGTIVNANETIAAVGSSGGQSRDGLYFEIRQGKTPQNPARWCR